ncbi:uncharacterized protein A4U43_C03F4500 [Asparagus officinalis]|uniref:Uncharacterized protein n=1 Tax=Asparagus officinalis TaxID=4686 RepID=A0A5P1FA24_ASPOF|nr:uncharacterized protein A4U43_C03F4500 [Asparagus officinalis]
MRSPLHNPPPSSLYHCRAIGLSGGSLVGTSETSKQTPPRKCLSPASAVVMSDPGGRSHTEISRVEESAVPDDEPREKAKVWSHSKNAPLRAVFVLTWHPRASILTWGLTSPGSDRARTTRTNK